MAVYVIVIALLIVLLATAYRALGGSSPRPIEQGALVRSVHGQLNGSLAVLGAWAHPDPATATLADAPRDGRRLAAGAQQLLDRLPPDAELDEATAAARGLLAAAAEDVAWAWRIVEASGASPGLTAAVIGLREHAAACCVAAAKLLEGATSGEPGDGP